MDSKLPARRLSNESAKSAVAVRRERGNLRRLITGLQTVARNSDYGLTIEELKAIDRCLDVLRKVASSRDDDAKLRAAREAEWKAREEQCGHLLSALLKQMDVATKIAIVAWRCGPPPYLTTSVDSFMNGNVSEPRFADALRDACYYIKYDVGRSGLSVAEALNSELAKFEANKQSIIAKHATLIASASQQDAIGLLKAIAEASKSTMKDPSRR